MATCQGCGVALPAQQYVGRHRKWCSERCRKATLYAGRCIDCGGPTNGSNGRGPHAPVRCGDCNTRRAAERTISQAEPRYEQIIQLRARGLRDVDIAKAVGYTHPGSVSATVLRLRKRGVNVVTTYRGFQDRA
jgi:hypothetical protein